MTQTHTVFGAGQIGIKLAHLLVDEGHAVRLVRRSAPGEPIEGVTWMQGDVTDLAFALEAATGAAVVYNCTNPPEYGKWEGIIEPLYRTVRKAAGRANVPLVQLDTLYMYGVPSRSPFGEDEPRRPCRPMGELRKMLCEELLEAHARGEVQATVGIAADYFGPDTPLSMVMRPDVLDAIEAGGSAWVFGNADMPHGYAFTPDVARGLLTLGANPTALGRTWHLPVAATKTTREVLTRFAERRGKKLKVREVPRWILRAAGTFATLPRAIADMSYQWDVPYVADDRAFVDTFGIAATNLDTAIDATMNAHVQARAAR